MGNMNSDGEELSKAKFRARLENVLGPAGIVGALPIGPVNSTENVELLSFARSPDNDSVTIVSNGLGSMVASQSGMRSLPAELLFCCQAKYFNRQVQAQIIELCQILAANPQEMEYGQLFKVGTGAVESSFTGFVTHAPVYHADEFDDDEELSAYFLWMIPITDDEYQFIQNKGWEAFEKIVVMEDPEFTDLNRLSVIK